ncbi:MAG: alpha-galactosidase [Lachnospiraceae bacterium]|nr:alpha-galactosidase [Lachnospiraceae bacterium]
MAEKIIKTAFGDMTGIYVVSENGAVSFTMAPANEENIHFNKCEDDSLVQVSCTGDVSSFGFCAGETRHFSGLTSSMKFESQDIEESDESKIVTTVLKNDEGLLAKHKVTFDKDSRSVRICTGIINGSKKSITLEALSSVNLSCLTPYAEDEGRNRLKLHRFKSRWSAEGRHEVRSIEELLLETSWNRCAIRTEKFGTVGSMPVRGYFPFAAIEDSEAGVYWAVSLNCSGSWQAELVRKNTGLSMSMGLADFDFGHWRKILRPGESFVSPEAYVTAVKGDLNTACDRLLDVQRHKLLETQRPANLPAIFNEYCTTWGEPSEKRISEILRVINGDNFNYFVIDAGWYADDIKGWQDNMGDWRYAKDLFPNGLKAVTDMIKEAGLKPGIWFELVVVGKDADIAQDSEHLLTRDGKVIICGNRRFFDMRSGWVRDYLTKKVINFLKDNGFEYIKIDYNDTIGIGCDGAESYGEGLRECMEATKAFYRLIREQVPGIAIEVCSSGGHRLEPGFMELGDYLSFSDAHEEKEIPVIAADLQSLVLSSKSQIWAVLRAADDLKRIAYSVCAAMYGVLCFSGDVERLSGEKWDFALKGLNFYKAVSPIIINGFTKRFGPFQNSNRELKGYQATVRYYEKEALALVHSFEHEGLNEIEIPLDKDFVIEDKFEASNHEIRIEGKMLKVKFKESFDALAIHLKEK